MEDLPNYLALLLLPEGEYPLQWWKRDSQTRFPTLFPLVKKYLSVPVTSVLAERVFSSGGDIITKKRNWFNDEDLRMPVVLHSNLPLILTFP